MTSLYSGWDEGRRTSGQVTTRMLTLALLTLMAACAAPPRAVDKGESHFNDRPASATPLSTVAYAKTGSGIRLLADPDEALQARLHLAALASSTLDLQYYLWQGDDSGMALTYEVLAAANRGVRVRILLDDIYHSGRDSAYRTLDAHPNVEVRLFNPMGNRGAAKTTNYALKKGSLNYRMHNKIFLADGVAAIMGGRNIGDEYFGRNPSFNFQDMDAIALGAVAAEAGGAFDLFWNAELAIPVSALAQADASDASADQMAMLAEARDRVRPSVNRGPAIAADHHAWLAAVSDELTWTDARVIVDRPDRSSDYPDSTFTTFIEDENLRPSASVVIQTAYLIPNGPTLGNLQAVAGNGVDLRILTNSAQSTNHNAVHAYYAPYRRKLLEAGIGLYEVQGTGALAAYLDRVGDDAHAGLHTKAMVIDGTLSVIGSYNMDPRSRVWNSEIALIVENADFAAQVLAEMERDFAPEAAWRLSLDEEGGLLWSGVVEGTPVQFNVDPGSSWLDRFLWRIMRVLPLENEL